MIADKENAVTSTSILPAVIDLKAPASSTRKTAFHCHILPVCVKIGTSNLIQSEINLKHRFNASESN